MRTHFKLKSPVIFLPKSYVSVAKSLFEIRTYRDNDTEIDVTDERDLMLHMYKIVIYNTQIGKETNSHWSTISW